MVLGGRRRGMARGVVRYQREWLGPNA